MANFPDNGTTHCSWFSTKFCTIELSLLFIWVLPHFKCDFKLGEEIWFRQNCGFLPSGLHFFQSIYLPVNTFFSVKHPVWSEQGLSTSFRFYFCYCMSLMCLKTTKTRVTNPSSGFCWESCFFCVEKRHSVTSQKKIFFEEAIPSFQTSWINAWME